MCSFEKYYVAIFWLLLANKIKLNRFFQISQFAI